MKRRLINDVYKIIKELNLAHSTCKSAISLGEWDFFVGGFFISLIKQKRISKLKGELAIAKKSIEVFKKNLTDSDISIEGHLNMEISDFLKVGDVFFDNMIFDLMVSSKLKKLSANIIETISFFETLRRNLEKN
ncbi:MAG: hypothetical protein ACRCYE_10170 [Sarcina sp.]